MFKLWSNLYIFNIFYIFTTFKQNPNHKRQIPKLVQTWKAKHEIPNFFPNSEPNGNPESDLKKCKNGSMSQLQEAGPKGHYFAA